MRYLAIAALLTGCANYVPPSDADFAAMRAAVQAMQPPPPQMVFPAPQQSVFCTTRPSMGVMTTICQ